MALVKVGLVSQIPPGTVVEAKAGGATYALCNAGGRLYALDGVCPHAGGPLGHGALHDTTLVCPWHAWEYDCRTGENGFGVTLDCFPVTIQGDDVLIDVP